MLRILRPFLVLPISLLLGLWLLPACGEIRIVPPDSGADGLDDSGDVGLPLSVTIESPQNGAKLNLGQNIHFAARVSGGQTPLDQLTATWTDSAQKTLNSGPVDAEGLTAFDKADLPPGPQTLHVEVSDGNGAHAGRDFGILINTPPKAPQVTIQPEQPTTLDNLTPVLTKPLSDVDRAPEFLSVQYSWHKLGETTEIAGNAQGQLPAGTHKRGETWIVSALATDGIGQSTAGTAQVVIADAPPTLPVLSISPADASLMSDVSCTTLATPSDPDGDAVTLKWGWKVGDYVNPGATTQQINIHKLASSKKGTPLKAGDNVYCTLVVADDQLNAPLATSVTLTVAVYDSCHIPPLYCDKNAECNPTDTLEPDCKCLSGFTGDGNLCLDIDECAATYCDPHANCTNLIGGFQCACKKGWSGNGSTCADVNECAQKPSPCGSNGTCVNSQGSYTCSCNPGYSGDGVSCKDIDECKLPVSACDPNAVCTNSVGGFSCSCNPGFGPAGVLPSGVTCTDVDECAGGKTGCSPDSICTNTTGGFQCACKPGFVDTSDPPNGQFCIEHNECNDDPAPCPIFDDCTNTVGSFQCTCKAGSMGDGTNCTDIDECQTGALICGPHAVCKNLVPGASCACQSGFVQDSGGNCVDVDECKNGTAVCDPQASCTNSEGSYVCKCNPGLFGNGKNCTTVDLCSPGSCADKATCETIYNDTSGQNEIKCTCFSGYIGFGTVSQGCTQVNECANFPCSGSADCTDLAPEKDGDPGFTCTCISGYSGDGFSCTDINECALSPAPCDTKNGTCSDLLPGKQGDPGYVCACKSGFEGDGVTCTNIDECTKTPGICGDSATTSCTDSEGSYTCTCNAGYAMSSGKCVDIDECGDGSAGCSVNATCTNAIPGFSCKCKDGFDGDGKTCTDIDECLTGTANCASDALCTNSPGSFSCACKSGFTGDGKTCTDIDECPGLDWSWDFAKDGGTGWSFDPTNIYFPSNPSQIPTSTPAPVEWQVWNGQLYYGNPGAQNYDTTLSDGSQWANSGNATGPLITLSAHPWHQLGFDLNINTEAGAYSDKLIVQLLVGTSGSPQVVTVWDKTQQIAAMGTQWHYTVYLNGYAGKTVRLRFGFDTADGGKNTLPGVYLNNLSIRGAGSPCHANAQCTNTPGSYLCSCLAPYAGDGVSTCNVYGTKIAPASSCKAIYDLNNYKASGFDWSGFYYLKLSSTPYYCESDGRTRVAQNDFNNVAKPWTPTTLSTCSGGAGLLGGYNVAGSGYAMTVSLANLPEHTQMRMQGTVMFIDAWSGQSVSTSLDGSNVWSDTASNPVVGGGHPDLCGDSLFSDSNHIIDVTKSHTAATALIQFTSTQSASAAIASYGLDNFSIWVQ